MSTIKIQVFITGKVQGVGYRIHTTNNAQKLNLTGWVKNLQDGSVKAIFEGDEESLKKIIEWCKEGPPFARVDNVEVYTYTTNDSFKDFRIAG